MNAEDKRTIGLTVPTVNCMRGCEGFKEEENNIHGITQPKRSRDQWSGLQIPVLFSKGEGMW